MAISPSQQSDPNEASRVADAPYASEFVDNSGNFDMDALTQALRVIDVDEKDLESVIVNYLFTNMYEESYINFIKETGYDGGPNLKDAISHRRDAKTAVLEGRIQDAIKITNAIDTDILEDNVGILFNLLSIELVEVIKKGDIMEAIHYARHSLTPIVKRDPKLIDKLEDVMGLFSFDDLASAEALEVMSKIQQPQRTADLLDKAVLEHFRMDSRSTLESLVKEARWVRNVLASETMWEKFQYKEFDRNGFTLKNV